MEIQERINNLMAATVVGTAVEQDLLRAGIITMGTALTATGGTSAPPLRDSRYATNGVLQTVPRSASKHLRPLRTCPV